MSRENILAVADAIEKHSIPDLGFNMADFIDRSGFQTDLTGHGCGTTACIGGWAAALMNGGQPTWMSDYKIAAWLGLGEVEMDNLFYADNHPLKGSDGTWFEDILPSTAVSVLRHLAETGEVDWDRALAGPSK